jgi:hypothetical protein
MQGFLLGIANGTLCVAYCAPVLVPYLLGEGKPVRRTAFLLGHFLVGRLIGYICFAMLAWVTGAVLLQNTAYRGRILGITYLFLAGVLCLYSIKKPKELCAASMMSADDFPVLSSKWPGAFPVSLGLLTGLNICPPFLLVFTEAANAGSLLHSIGFFFMFFLGTMVYFVPLPFLGFLNRFPQFRTVGKLTTAVLALYYCYIGIILAGGQ